ncbi:hypothetical protein SBOR_9996 [Sclerotinia borealis F-4128]|uniref:Uncharacterized protein n=1 Tax=Sclerotinia borealis (strain F-4128) TaxID=1432307 RepID=W9C4W4_SCLBF|nr:hypothetical protein SBOR_9996 [Sclerotinia borealis F-4128]
MVHQPSSWELSLDRAKQQFREHQDQRHDIDTRSRPIDRKQNTTQQTSAVMTSARFKCEEYNSHVDNTLFNSRRMGGINKTIEPQRNSCEKYNFCTDSNRGEKRGGQAQQAPNIPSNWIAATSTKDISAAASRKVLDSAGIRDIMIRHLGLNTENQNQYDSASNTTHPRTFLTSSRPSMPSSFASTASTEITTSVLDQNQFEMLNWNGAMSATQPISMPNNFHEQELFAMSSRDGLVLDRYREHKKVDSPASVFVPSAILKGERRFIKPEMARKAAQVGISLNPNYKGELTNFNLRNAMCLDHENCSVRIHNIPAKASHSEIFGVVTHGKVFSFNYIPAVENVFAHAAADLVFLTREAAEYFINDAKFGRGLYIRDQKIKVLWNRVKVLPAEGRYERMSRVVRIKGPANGFSVEILVRFFRSKFVFDLITSDEWVQWDGCKIIELAFSSIRSQSESAMKSFKLYVNQNMPNAGYHIWYAPDPCCELIMVATSDCLGIRDSAFQW